jgi:hypothetical protein
MNFQRVLVLLVGVGAITALTLPGRQSAQILKAGGDAFNSALGTAIKG